MGANGQTFSPVLRRTSKCPANEPARPQIPQARRRNGGTETDPASALETAPAATSSPSGQGSSLPGITTCRAPARPPPQGCPSLGPPAGTGSAERCFPRGGQEPPGRCPRPRLAHPPGGQPPTKGGSRSPLLGEHARRRSPARTAGPSPLGTPASGEQNRGLTWGPRASGSRRGGALVPMAAGGYTALSRFPGGSAATKPGPPGRRGSGTRCRRHAGTAPRRKHRLCPPRGGGRGPRWRTPEGCGLLGFCRACRLRWDEPALSRACSRQACWGPRR